MKKFICDICGLSVDQFYLTELYKDFQSEGIEHVCNDCRKEIEKTKLKIDAVVRPIKHSWLKKILIKMKKEKTK